LLATVYTLLSPGAPPAATGADGAANTVTAPATKTQFIAKRYIPPRTQLSSTLFRQDEVPESEVPPGAITDLGTLKGLLSKEAIAEGEPLTRDTTTPAVQRVVPANIPIPQGFRAVAIYVNPTQTAAGLVDVGDRVDVIATHRFGLTAGANSRVEGAPSITAGRVVGQNLLVLAVDKSINAPPPTPTPPPQVPGAPAPPNAPATNTVAATPVPQPGADDRIRVLLAAPLDIATRMVAAEEEGKLHIVIRNPSGADQQPVPEVREYPSRVVAVPQPRQPSGGNSSGAGNSDDGGFTRRSRSDISDIQPSVPSIPSPVVSNVPPASVSTGNTGLPAPSGGSTAAAPQAPQENEVTVIRGTEKTRVVVPR
jgi:Flp pilus assembly protein CpaB